VEDERWEPSKNEVETRPGEESPFEEKQRPGTGGHG